MEYEKVDKVPPIMGRFEPPEETLEMAAVLRGLNPGDVVKFPISGNQNPKDYRREINRIKARSLSAIKLAKDGIYRSYIRKGNIYVERLE